MLIHECEECGSMSINRIAADDDPDSIMEVFQASLALGHNVSMKCKEQGVAILHEADIVSAQLYGYAGLSMAG